MRLDSWKELSIGGWLPVAGQYGLPEACREYSGWQRIAGNRFWKISCGHAAFLDMARRLSRSDFRDCGAPGCPRFPRVETSKRPAACHEHGRNLENIRG